MSLTYISYTKNWPIFIFLLPRIVCVFVFSPLLFPYRARRMRASNSACKTDQAHVIHWMSFIDVIHWMSFIPFYLLSSLWKYLELSIREIPSTFHQDGNAGKTMIKVKHFNIANCIANLYWK